MANGTIYWRIQRVEEDVKRLSLLAEEDHTQLVAIRAEQATLQRKCEGIEAELKSLHEDYSAGQRGMTRTDKIMFSGIIIAAISAVVGAVALLAGSV